MAERRTFVSVTATAQKDKKKSCAAIVLTQNNYPPLYALSFLDSVHPSAKVSCWAEQSEDGLVPIFVGERLFH